MAQQKKHTLKTYLFTGILVTAPVAITFYVAIKLFYWLDNLVTNFIPAKYNPETYLPYGLPGLGILLLLTFFILIGMMTANVLGRWLMGIGQKIIGKMPIISGVYNALKKVFETLLGSSSTEAFRKAVLIEYPRKGLWTIAFLTGPVYQGFQDLMPKDMVTVYVPTTPNPTSGFMIYVPKKDIQVLDIRVDDALKMVISMGIVMPVPHPQKGQKQK
ncbi:MAG: DUF502 domain-containing protein [Alphaproteobacteria bacterium]|nr:DUF502 domain-containing protein [Alphaproteobacteria bacterium]